MATTFKYGAGGTWGRVSAAFSIPSYILQGEFKRQLQPKIRVITNKYGIRMKRDAKEYYPNTKGDFRMQTSNWDPIAIALITDDPRLLFIEEDTLPHIPPSYMDGSLHNWVRRHESFFTNFGGGLIGRAISRGPRKGYVRNFEDISLQITYIVSRNIGIRGTRGKHRLGAMLAFESKSFVKEIQQLVENKINSGY